MSAYFQPQPCLLASVCSSLKGKGTSGGSEEWRGQDMYERKRNLGFRAGESSAQQGEAGLEISSEAGVGATAITSEGLWLPGRCFGDNALSEERQAIL